MPITQQQSNHLKSIAILMMLCLHLFNRDYTDLFSPLIFIGQQPLSYYISLFCDACVPVFAFVSGYGLYYNYKNKALSYADDNWQRLKKLYINYWIILLLFVVILGSILGKEGYPGSWQKLAIAITGLQSTYNGAWWFLTTYVFFVLSSKFWFKLLDKSNPYFYLLFLFGGYVVAFYFRVYKANVFSHQVLDYFHTQGALYFCTLFQFMLGAFALKFKWNEKTCSTLKRLSFVNNWTLCGGIVLLIIIHALFPNLIIAPFTALGFIFIFTQLKLPQFLSKILDFMAVHSTNLWLIHMFFYMIYFKEIIYAPQYPILIFGCLVLWCVIASYMVNAIYTKIEKALL